MEIIVRDFQRTAREIQALRELVRLWEAEETFWSFDQVISALSQNNIAMRTADQQDHMVGVVLWQDLVDAAEILWVYVLADFRRQGIAQTLIRNLQEQYRRIFLEVKASNERAIALYQGLGFVQYGRRPRYYRDGQDAWLLRWEHSAG